MPIVRAIDVGYGNTKFTLTPGVDTGDDCMIIPSVAVRARGSKISASIGAARMTYTIPVDGIKYEVGVDARLAKGAAYLQGLHDDYCLTAEYTALVRGALQYMAVPFVDLLVLGLPVSTYHKRRAELIDRISGSHDLVDGKLVEVRNVQVLAQPCGALMHFLNSVQSYSVKRQRSLVIDCGSRTVDWVVADGLQVRDELSGAVNRGMHDILESIARGISEAEHTTFRDLDRIDAALREATAPLVFGKPYDILPFRALADKIAQDAVAAIKKHVDDAGDIDNIVLAGGSSFFYKPTIQAAFPRHTLHVVPSPVFANVRGFQLAGEWLYRHQHQAQHVSPAAAAA